MADQPMTCPVYVCKSIVYEDTLVAYLPGNQIWTYENRLLDAVRKSKSNLFQCAQCLRMLKVQNRKNSLPISCKCGAFWCLNCKRESHWPARCNEMEIYEKAVYIGDRESRDFFFENGAN